jgi:hypothetical protein
LNRRDLVKEGIAGAVCRGVVRRQGLRVLAEAWAGLRKSKDFTQREQRKNGGKAETAREIRHLAIFFWNFRGLEAEYVTRVAPGRPIV